MASDRQNGSYRETGRREVEVDIGARVETERRGSSVTWVVLAAGLLLTALLMRFGIWFFFLPIIIPFGLRGGSLFGSASTRRRVVRLEGSTLSLVKRTWTGLSEIGSVDVGGGVFLSVSETGLRVNGLSESIVRVAGADGAFEVLVSDVGDARRLKQRLATMLGEASVRVVEPDSILQGGVAARPTASGQEFLWQGRRARPWGGRRTTRLSIDADGWTLQVHSGSRLESSTGGPGVPELRLAAVERVDPFESGVIARELCLEIVWEGKVVARVGGDLSEPELRFVLSRLPFAQPRRLTAR